jgi:hypothetical protein
MFYSVDLFVARRELPNAPSYLVFFELAGGDAEQLMGPLPY